MMVHLDVHLALADWLGFLGEEPDLPHIMVMQLVYILSDHTAS